MNFGCCGVFSSYFSSNFFYLNILNIFLSTLNFYIYIYAYLFLYIYKLILKTTYVIFCSLFFFCSFSDIIYMCRWTRIYLNGYISPFISTKKIEIKNNISSKPKKSIL